MAFSAASQERSLGNSKTGVHHASESSRGKASIEAERFIAATRNERTFDFDASITFRVVWSAFSSERPSVHEIAPTEPEFGKLNPPRPRAL